MLRDRVSVSQALTHRFTISALAVPHEQHLLLSLIAQIDTSVKAGHLNVLQDLGFGPAVLSRGKFLEPSQA